MHGGEEFLEGGAVHGGDEVCKVRRTAGRLGLLGGYLLGRGLAILGGVVIRSLGVSGRAWGEVCRFGSDNEFCCYARIELGVFVEADVVYALSTVEDLKGYLASDLRLAEDFNNGLHSFNYLSLDHCFKRHATRQLKDAASKTTVTE